MPNFVHWLSTPFTAHIKEKQITAKHDFMYQITHNGNVQISYDVSGGEGGCSNRQSAITWGGGFG